MVNHLMRGIRTPTEPYGDCTVRMLAEFPEHVGMVELRKGDEAEISWAAARILRREGKVEILNYSESLLESFAYPEEMDAFDPPEKTDIPGFICDFCWAEGIVKRYANRRAWLGHQAYHYPSKKRGPKPKPKRKTRKPRK